MFEAKCSNCGHPLIRVDMKDGVVTQWGHQLPKEPENEKKDVCFCGCEKGWGES